LVNGLKDLMINSVIGFDLLPEKQGSLIERDILMHFDIIMTNSKKDCKITKI